MENSATLAAVHNRTRDVCLGEAVEIADNSAKRNRGLLGRDGLPDGGGLWITPCEAIHMFFMRFAIDVVFLDREQRVTKVVPRLKPWRLAASLKARSVLELPAGTAERTGTAPGDRIEIVRHAQG